MSHSLINRSKDLKLLRDEGYEIEIQGNHLLVKNIPYVNSRREIKQGILISELSLAGDITTTPHTHIALFAGEYPCNKDGSQITKIMHENITKKIGHNIVANFSFSSKPAAGYVDFHEKMTAYIRMISHPAQSLDSSFTPKNFNPIESNENESRFKYIDTASSRAGINIVSKKLESQRIGIIGLGGTGSYILDLVAKTPVEKIVLFDKF